MDLSTTLSGLTNFGKDVGGFIIGFIQGPLSIGIAISIIGIIFYIMYKIICALIFDLEWYKK